MTVTISEQHNEDRLAGTLAQLTRGEATARLFLALNGRACRCLDAAQVGTLRRRFPVDC